jgi:hypothetical protein
MFLEGKLQSFGEKSSSLMAGERPALVFFWLHEVRGGQGGRLAPVCLSGTHRTRYHNERKDAIIVISQVLSMS